MRGAVLGDAYEREDIGADAARTLAAAAAGGGGKLIEGAVGPTNLLTRTLVQLPGEAITHGTDMAVSDEDLTWGTVGRHVVEGGTSAVAAGLGDTVEDSVSTRAGNGLGGRVASRAVGGLVERSSGAAMNANTWDEGVGQGMIRVAGSGLRGAAQNGVTAAGSHMRQSQIDAESRAAAQRHHWRSG